MAVLSAVSVVGTAGPAAAQSAVPTVEAAESAAVMPAVAQAACGSPVIDQWTVAPSSGVEKTRRKRLKIFSVA